jgi:hypothetical protein
MKMWVVGEKIKTTANGIYDKGVGKAMIKLI